MFEATRQGSKSWRVVPVAASYLSVYETDFAHLAQMARSIPLKVSSAQTPPALQTEDGLAV